MKIVDHKLTSRNICPDSRTAGGALICLAKDIIGIKNLDTKMIEFDVDWELELEDPTPNSSSHILCISILDGKGVIGFIRRSTTIVDELLRSLEQQ